MKTKPNSLIFNFFRMIILPLVLLVLFLWASAIHEVIEEGEAFGFIIGMDKAEVVVNLSTNPEKPIEIINLVSADRSSELVTLASPISDFYDSNKWVVMYDSSFFFDSVTLEFCNDYLCKIFRKRQYLELP